jgi:hypothetical protein
MAASKNKMAASGVAAFIRNNQAWRKPSKKARRNQWRQQWRRRRKWLISKAVRNSKNAISKSSLEMAKYVKRRK